MSLILSLILWQVTPERLWPLARTKTLDMSSSDEDSMLEDVLEHVSYNAGHTDVSSDAGYSLGSTDTGNTDGNSLGSSSDGSTGGTSDGNTLGSTDSRVVRQHIGNTVSYVTSSVATAPVTPVSTPVSASIDSDLTESTSPTNE
eukprot:scaffold10185_cov283-Chaetoceros_neogracile.AAC.5